MLAGSRLLVEIAVKHQNNSWLYYEIWARLCIQTRYTIVSICLLPNLAFFSSPDCLLACWRKKINDSLGWREWFLVLNSNYGFLQCSLCYPAKGKGLSEMSETGHSTSVPVFPNKRGQSLPSICKSQFHEATPPLPPEHTASGQTNIHGKGHRW